MFEFFDKNPHQKFYTRGRNKGKLVSKTDCVIRAMMQILEKSWLETALLLTERGCQIGETQTACKTYETFLKPSGIKVMKEGMHGRRYKTIREFAKETEHSYVGYIVHAPHHLVFIKHGKYYDSWDSGSETVRKIWVLK